MVIFKSISFYQFHLIFSMIIVTEITIQKGIPITCIHANMKTPLQQESLTVRHPFLKLQDVTQYFIKILFKSLERINDARLQLSHMIVMPLFATIINLSYLSMGF